MSTAFFRGITKSYPDSFTFNKPSKGIVDIRDFGTTGVVAFARGCPFAVMPTGKLTIGGLRVQVKAEYRDQALEAIDGIIEKLGHQTFAPKAAVKL